MVYTRETVGAIDGFLISSAERMGDKTGRKPARRRQALELNAPADQWDELAAIVTHQDPIHRPVFRNKSFTAAWAEKIF